MEALEARVEALEAWEKNPVGQKPAPLTKADYAKVTRYRPYRNTADACYAAGFVSEGREGGFLHGGFLRYRKMSFPRFFTFHRATPMQRSTADF
jgi:hypothetical protein